jgi:hypothetical protein
MPLALLRNTLLLSFLLSVTVFGAGKPSWQTFGLFIDPVLTMAEANRIQTAVVAYDAKQIKAAYGLTPENGFLLIEHDHHNIRFQNIAAAIHKLGDYKITVPMLIPDYQRVQGTPIGERLHSILNNPDLPYQIERIDPAQGLFHIVLPAGPPQPKGFNFGDMAHPLSDPVNYGGIGLPMSFPGLKGVGGMSKDPKLKSIQFRKAGKKEKPFDPAILDAHRALFPDA